MSLETIAECVSTYKVRYLSQRYEALSAAILVALAAQPGNQARRRLRAFTVCRIVLFASKDVLKVAISELRSFKGDRQRTTLSKYRSQHGSSL